ncbi:unnamed protein product [Leptidea sinapis]|uniref:Uncharacterized protein n=1 Tax=Leptidea sinapis TaxID=189913 RepID=A0A5E4QPD9_9NEOP|nr:unnamed protein product [Leptidea sinapis]
MLEFHAVSFALKSPARIVGSGESSKNAMRSSAIKSAELRDASQDQRNRVTLLLDSYQHLVQCADNLGKSKVQQCHSLRLRPPCGGGDHGGLGRFAALQCGGRRSARCSRWRSASCGRWRETTFLGVFIMLNVDHLSYPSQEKCATS